MWIDAAEALRLLGIRPQSLYAAVSRGRIRTRPDPGDARRSLYNREDVERLAVRRPGRQAAMQIAAEAMDWGMPVLETSVSTIVNQRPYYRGRDAVQLSRSHSLEAVAALLWQAETVEFVGSPGRRASAPAGSAIGMMLGLLAQAAGEGIPLSGLSVRSAHRQAAMLIGDVADCLFGQAQEEAAPLHQRMAQAWRAPGSAQALRQALVLMADHELNASTFAARVCASTDAPLSACLLAGLASLTGARHGGASQALQLLLEAARRSGARQAVRQWLATGQKLPGFGHPLYPDGDPRAKVLLQGIEADDLFEELRAAVQAASGEEPNIDFALAGLAMAHRLPQEAPLVIFAMGRMVGWTAHCLEQAAQGRLIRPRAQYVGTAPDSGIPQSS